jgi:hypothetical protein
LIAGERSICLLQSSKIYDQYVCNAQNSLIAITTATSYHNSNIALQHQHRITTATSHHNSNIAIITNTSLCHRRNRIAKTGAKSAHLTSACATLLSQSPNRYHINHISYIANITATSLSSQQPLF